jgi:hypothetical protein
MRRKELKSLLFTFLALSIVLRLEALSTPSVEVEFLNAPVLFEEGGKSFQQVLASYVSDKAGKIVITMNGTRNMYTPRQPCLLYSDPQPGG